MNTSSRVVVLCVLALVVTMVTAGFEYPLYSQCEESFNSLTSTSGLTMCGSGSFVTSLAMGLTGTAAITHMNQDPHPEYTPLVISDYIRGDGQLMAEFDDMLFSNKVIPEFVELLSQNIHYNGVITRSRDLMDICHDVNDSDAFYLADTDFTHDMTGQAVVLVTGCDYTSELDEFELTIFHPKYGVMFVSPSDLINLHEFLVAYDEVQLQHNIRRVTSGDLNMSPYPQYETIGESLQAVPFAYNTYFKQCDGRWGSHVMSSKTVCQVGCLMNSICVGIRGHGITVSGKACDPGVFNKWLRSNGGYTRNMFIHGVMNKLCSGRGCTSRFPGDGAQGRMSISTVQSWLKRKRVMTANVKNGGHWVLVYGWDNSNPKRLLTRDSAGADRKWHNLSEVVAWRVYDLKGPATKSEVWDDVQTEMTQDQLEQIARDLGF